MRRPIRSDQSIASLNQGVTGMPQFSIYQIIRRQARVAASGGRRTEPQQDHPMITKRSLMSLAGAGGLAAILRDQVRSAAAEAASRMLVGFGAGGAIDVIARMLVAAMKG